MHYDALEYILGVLEAEMEKVGDKGNNNYYNKPLDFAHMAMYLKVYFILLIVNIKNVKYLAEKGKHISNTFSLNLDVSCMIIFYQISSKINLI